MTQQCPLIDIHPDHWTIVHDILQKHVPQHAVWAFGSRATWKAKEFSDLDLAIITETPLPPDVSASLREEFSESDLPWKVDVIDWATTSEVFRAIVERDRVVVQEGRKNLARSLETLADFARRGDISISTGPFGSALHAHDYLPTGVAVVPTEAISAQGLLHDKFVRISREKARELERHKLQEGDIIFARRGVQACGISTRVSAADGEVIAGTGAITLRNHAKGKIDSRFLAFAVGSNDSVAWLKHHAIGATMPNLNSSVILSLPIAFPPISQQRAIAHILGTLDDKIELLRKQNETLEAMARALFKAWFVDFEPVRAKLEGRWQPGQSLPGLPAHLYHLFPDRLVDSELGEIPEGWRRSTIGEEATVSGGSTPSTKEPEFWEGGEHCWATPKDLSALKFPVLLDTERRITDAGLGKISSGLLPVGTVLLSSRAPIGYLAIAEVPTAINQGFIAMKCDGVLPNVFVLHWCRESMDAIVGNANGSTFQEISKGNFRPIPIVVPSEPVLAIYSGAADALHQNLADNERESRSLAQLRDTLLPKLISGELRVADTERVAMAVA